MNEKHFAEFDTAPMNKQHPGPHARPSTNTQQLLTYGCFYLLAVPLKGCIHLRLKTGLVHGYSSPRPFERIRGANPGPSLWHIWHESRPPHPRCGEGEGDANHCHHGTLWWCGCHAAHRPRPCHKVGMLLCDDCGKLVVLRH